MLLKIKTLREERSHAATPVEILVIRCIDLRHVRKINYNSVLLV